MFNLQLRTIYNIFLQKQDERNLIRVYTWISIPSLYNYLPGVQFWYWLFHRAEQERGRGNQQRRWNELAHAPRKKVVSLLASTSFVHFHAFVASILLQAKKNWPKKKKTVSLEVVVRFNRLDDRDDSSAFAIPEERSILQWNCPMTSLNIQ